MGGGGVSILQYADDTIIFMEHDIDKVVNMKLILCLFEQLFRLKIKFTRVKYSASDVPKRKKIITCIYLVVRLVRSHLVISGYQHTIEKSLIKSGNVLMTGLKRNLVLGKVKCCLMVTG